MKTKKNISLSINPKLYSLIDKHFDNKSKLVEWAIIQILSMDEDFKEELKKIII